MKKILIIVLSMLFFITSIYPLITASDHIENDDFQIEDRKMDVKFLGLFPLFPQKFFSSADLVTVAFSENEEKPDKLFITMTLRDLSRPVKNLDTGYTVSWWMNSIRYCCVVHYLPSEQISQYIVGYSDEYNDEIIEWNNCEGSFDQKENRIIWEISKDLIGDPILFIN